jgi:hypothetical protein
VVVLIHDNTKTLPSITPNAINSTDSSNVQQVQLVFNRMEDKISLIQCEEDKENVKQR